MIIGIGIDILEKKRITAINKKYGYFFEKKILNNTEIKNYKSSKKKITNIAKLFSLKEAFIKSLGTGFIKNFSFKKIKIKHTKLGKPLIKKRNIKIYTSISHEKNIIIAMAITKINK
ncbi:MAG TPA: holo-ACP synthase [Candidatus Azoamicus sp.]